MGKRQKLGDERYVFLRWRDRSEQRPELVELCFGRVAVLEPCLPLELTNDREKGGVPVVRRAKVLSDIEIPFLETLPNHRRQARFANTRLSREQHDPPAAILGLLPEPQQTIELFFAADERCLAGAQRLEPAVDAARARYQPSPLRVHQPFEPLRPKIDELEERPQLSARAVGNYHGVWLGERLQSRGNVRRLTDDSLLLGCARPNQITDNRESRSDPDAASQLDVYMRPQYAHGANQREPGSHRPFSIVLTRLRVT